MVEQASIEQSIEINTSKGIKYLIIKVTPIVTPEKYSQLQKQIKT